MHIHKHAVETQKSCFYMPFLIERIAKPQAWLQIHSFALPQVRVIIQPIPPTNPKITSQGMPCPKPVHGAGSPDSREVFITITPLGRGSPGVQWLRKTQDQKLPPAGTNPQTLKSFLRANCSFPPPWLASSRAGFWCTAFLVAIMKNDNIKFPELLAPKAKTAHKF